MGGIIGNIAGGKLFDRMQFRAVGLILVWSIAVLLFFPSPRPRYGAYC